MDSQRAFFTNDWSNTSSALFMLAWMLLSIFFRRWTNFGLFCNLWRTLCKSELSLVGSFSCCESETSDRNERSPVDPEEASWILLGSRSSIPDPTSWPAQRIFPCASCPMWWFFDPTPVASTLPVHLSELRPDSHGDLSLLLSVQ